MKTGKGSEMHSPRRDVFLCHAHTDKDKYVRPLAAELRKYGITYWIDEAEIKLGDHITEKVNEGLRESRFVIVFVTENFLQRNWPRIELYGAFGMEARSGEVVVLPVLAAPDEIWFDQFPLLADKLFLRWTDGVQAIARAVAERVGTEFREDWQHHFDVGYVGPVWIRILQFIPNVGREHVVKLKWGPWECGQSLTGMNAAICLLTSKGPDTMPVPLFISVRPAANVSFGIGNPPCDDIVDINHKWCRIE